MIFNAFSPEMKTYLYSPFMLSGLWCDNLMKDWPKKKTWYTSSVSKGVTVSTISELPKQYECRDIWNADSMIFIIPNLVYQHSMCTRTISISWLNNVIQVLRNNSQSCGKIPCIPNLMPRTCRVRGTIHDYT